MTSAPRRRACVYAQVSRLHSTFVQFCESDCLAARAVLNGAYTGERSGTLTISGSPTPLPFTSITLDTLSAPASCDSDTDLFSIRGSVAHVIIASSCRPVCMRSHKGGSALGSPVCLSHARPAPWLDA